MSTISGVTGVSGVAATGSNDQDSRLMQLISKIDSDGDGRINKDEFTSFAAKVTEKTGQSVDLDKLFSKYDGDSDGSLSNAEMKKLLTSGDLQAPAKSGKAAGGAAPAGGGAPAGGAKGGGAAGGSSSSSSDSETYSEYDLNEDGKVTAEEILEYNAKKTEQLKSMTGSDDDGSTGMQTEAVNGSNGSVIDKLL